MSVAAIGVLTLVLSFVTALLSPLLAWLFSVLVLYFAIDIGAARSRLKETLLALRRGGSVSGQTSLAADRRLSVADDGNGQEAIASFALQDAIRSAHQRGFAPLLWFMLFGPAGAAAYCTAETLARCWLHDKTLGSHALRGFEWFDWLPQRLTALTFAVVGDFEDALLCWRTQSRVAAGSSTLVVAAGAGACGVRLTLDSAELGLGELPDADSLEAAEAMLWRAALLWLGAMFVIGVALWLG